MDKGNRRPKHSSHIEPCYIIICLALSVFFFFVSSKNLVFNESIHRNYVLFAIAHESQCSSRLPLTFHFSPHVGIPFPSISVSILFVGPSGSIILSIPGRLDDISTLIVSCSRRRYCWWCRANISSSHSIPRIVLFVHAVVCSIHLCLDCQAPSRVLLN